MISFARLCLILSPFCCGIPCATAQDADPARHLITIPPTPDFEITGDGSAIAWRAASWTSIPGRHGSRSRYETRAKLLYSETGIYGLFFCEDNRITATLKEDFANLYNEDVVEIFFWPDESMPVYFEYELSPLGYELAIVVPNLKGNFFGWRPWHYEGTRLTRHAAHVQPGESWTAEFFIPYTLLKPLIMGAPKKAERWRVNLYRIDYDEGDSEWSWQPTQKNFHDYERFGTMEFK